MRNYWLASVIVLGACSGQGGNTVSTLSLAAQVDFYLKIEGIQGETQGKPPGSIELMSFSFGVDGGAQGVVRAVTSCDTLPCTTVQLAARAPGNDFASAIFQHRVPILVSGFLGADKPWHGVTFLRPSEDPSDGPVESLSINFS